MSFLTTLLPAAKTASSGNFFSDNFLTIALVVVLVIMVVFMVRNSRKRKRDAEELQSKFVPGAEVMTQHGIYGTLVSVDEDKNEAIIETTPGTRLRVHRQTVARVVEPADVDPGKDIVADETPAAVEGEPAYGERITNEHAENEHAENEHAGNEQAGNDEQDAAADVTATAAPARAARAPRKKPAAGDDSAE